MPPSLPPTSAISASLLLLTNRSSSTSIATTSTTTNSTGGGTGRRPPLPPPWKPTRRRRMRILTSVQPTVSTCQVAQRYAVLAVPATAVKILSQITIIQDLPFSDCCVKYYNLDYGILSFLLSYSLALKNDNDNDDNDDDDDDDDNDDDDKEESCILFPCERYAVDNEPRAGFYTTVYGILLTCIFTSTVTCSVPLEQHSVESDQPAFLEPADTAAIDRDSFLFSVTKGRMEQ
ncbi:hypothetical protein V1478_007335 [Vespula squamosa]|uniref:Uncharacterized protein n=1 Tax=Vespula squamosa TaxID=30214 RepID=A0ABD2B2T9_VESSQ